MAWRNVLGEYMKKQHIIFFVLGVLSIFYSAPVKAARPEYRIRETARNAPLFLRRPNIPALITVAIALFAEYEAWRTGNKVEPFIGGLLVSKRQRVWLSFGGPLFVWIAFSLFFSGCHLTERRRRRR